MQEFRTPKGTIKMMIDGQSVDFEVVPVAGSSLDGCYKIPVEFKPDGRDHQIACCFLPDLWVQGYGSSGERYMVTAFYDNKKYFHEHRSLSTFPKVRTCFSLSFFRSSFFQR